MRMQFVPGPLFPQEALGLRLVPMVTIIDWFYCMPLYGDGIGL